MKRFGNVLALGIIVAAMTTAAWAQDNAEQAVEKTVDPNAVVENGKKVQFDYTLKVDGQVVESSEGKPPLSYTQGAGDIIPGLESQLTGLRVGDSKTVTVEAKDAYGEVQQEAIREFPVTAFPEDFKPEVGAVVQLEDEAGNVAPAIISEIKDDKVMLNFNHPLAGKTLEFDIKIVSIE